MAKISIIIPIYNVEEYIGRCLDSLCNQTLDDIEIICIDDCSTDNSLKILKEYQAKDDRIKIIELKENSGAAIARNKGLDIAQGEYLGFVDSDDEVDLNFYEELYNKAKETRADITKANSKYIDYDGRESISSQNKNIRKYGKYRFKDNWVTALYNRNFILNNKINFPDECVKGQDIVFLTKAVVLSNKVEVIDNVYYYYYRRENSLDSKELPLKSIKSVALCRKIISNFINSSELHSKDLHNYNYIYLMRLCDNLHFIFRTDKIEGKAVLIKTFIDNYNDCLNKDFLDKHFPYSWMVSYIKNKEYEKLTRMILKYSREKDLIYSKNVFEKIFSIKQDYYRMKKIITIAGTKFSIDINNKEKDKCYDKI